MADIITKTSATVAKKGLSNVGEKAAGQAGGKVLAALSPLAALETIVTSYADYKKTASQEKTKRRQIQAWQEVELEKIRAQRDLFMMYLERTFDERKANFAKFFEVLDHAVETDAVDVIGKTLDSITTLAKTSPFKDIATVAQVRKVLDDPDKNFDL